MQIIKRQSIEGHRAILARECRSKKLLFLFFDRLYLGVLRSREALSIVSTASEYIKLVLDLAADITTQLMEFARRVVLDPFPICDSWQVVVCVHEEYPRRFTDTGGDRALVARRLSSFICHVP